MTPMTDEEVRALLDGATPDEFKARKGHDDEEWEIYPTRGGRKPSIKHAIWAEIATVKSDNENHPERAKGNARLFAAARALARDLLAARAELARVTAERDALAARAGDIAKAQTAEREDGE